MFVNGLLHYGLQVPDLAQGSDFYSDFGLTVGQHDNQVVIRCDGRDQDQTILVEGPDKRLHHVAFAAPAGTLGELQRHLERSDVTIVDPPPGIGGEGLWFRDPDGNTINVREQDLAPARAVEPAKYNFADDYRRVDEALWTGTPTRARPRRLGHVLIFSSDVNRSQDFYQRALGLRLSDRIPGLVVFLNSGPGDHHVFGFIQSSHPGLHHSSWEVGAFDELAVGAFAMADKGHEIGWGLGRHSLGSNLFHYIQDPWGSWIEYFADIDRIGEHWQGRDWDIPPSVWCPPMPAQFLTNQEIKPE